ncbi:hypothetical protein Nepgr_003212 [Nepenthes gracilis]|uniref:Uncharacterized protein n=1 Tax=Nepenthes gracilis TaxID=150966 RepID=A0AAD3RZ32_NEPGR|nr:hypothetical protein Nepgr_003212 [Nepenthes gracilis]
MLDRLLLDHDLLAIDWPGVSYPIEEEEEPSKPRLKDNYPFWSFIVPTREFDVSGRLFGTGKYFGLLACPLIQGSLVVVPWELVCPLAPRSCHIGRLS